MNTAHQFKNKVNGQYRVTRDRHQRRVPAIIIIAEEVRAIEMEGDNPPMEIKRLDMEQREYCVSSKNISEYVPIL